MRYFTAQTIKFWILIFVLLAGVIIVIMVVIIVAAVLGKLVVS